MFVNDSRLGMASRTIPIPTWPDHLALEQNDAGAEVQSRHNCILTSNLRWEHVGGGGTQDVKRTDQEALL